MKIEYRESIDIEEVPSLNYETIKNGGEDKNEYDVVDYLEYFRWMLCKRFHPDRIIEMIDEDLANELRKRDENK